MKNKNKNHLTVPIHIENVSIEGFETGIGVTGNTPTTIKDVDISGVKNGIIHKREDHNIGEKWHNTWWGGIILMIFGGLLVAFLVYRFGWH